MTEVQGARVRMGERPAPLPVMPERDDSRELEMSLVLHFGGAFLRMRGLIVHLNNYSEKLHYKKLLRIHNYLYLM